MLVWQDSQKGRSSCRVNCLLYTDYLRFINDAGIYKHINYLHKKYKMDRNTMKAKQARRLAKVGIDWEIILSGVGVCQIL